MGIKNGRWRLALGIGIVFILVLGGGCRLQYNENIEADELDANVPNVELFRFNQQVYQNGRLLLELRAEGSRAFQSRNLRELDGVVFVEYDAQGEVVAEGHAEKASLFTDTENVELRGSIMVYSKKEEATLVGDYFYWDSDSRTISSLLESLVALSTDQGEEITGWGFKADMSRRKIEFTEGVEGIIQDDN